MGFFKKSVQEIVNDENDDQIRREIRARVAKQAGIDDEEYIRTGKFGGDKKDIATPEVIAASETSQPQEAPAKVAPTDFAASHVSAAAIPVMPVDQQAEVTRIKEIDAKPEISVEPKPEIPVAPKPVKVKKEKPAKEVKAAGDRQKPKKKNRNIALILFIIALLLAFIPLYCFITEASHHAPTMSITSTVDTLVLGKPLLVQGTVSDTSNAAGIKVFYSLDNGSASLFHTFSAEPGPFEYEITLPNTIDFVGEHSISIYAEDASGDTSEPVVQNFTVTKLDLTGIKITTPPTKVKYQVGDALSL